MKSIRYLSLALFIFSSFFLQFCDKRSTCSGGVSRSVIESYRYNRIFRMNAVRHVTLIPEDSISMTANDTIYMEFWARTRTAMNYTIGNYGSLFACTPSIEMIDPLGDSIMIETMDDFDATHSSGSNISGFFRLFGPGSYDSGRVKEYYPVNRFKEFHNDRMSFILALVKKPEFRDIRFKVHFYKKKLAEAVRTETTLLRFY
jgi:hypothetical protein